MKQLFKKGLVGAGILAACLCAQAQNSPTGTVWDCLINGSQGVGVAYLEFLDDGTLSGISVLRPNVPVPVQSSGTNSTEYGRGDAGDTRRRARQALGDDKRGHASSPQRRQRVARPGSARPAVAHRCPRHCHHTHG